MVDRARSSAMTRHTSPAGQHDSNEPVQRKSHPLFWLLVLAALLTIVWSIYNRWASETTPASVQPPAGSAAQRDNDRSVDAQPVRPARSPRAPQP
jgi:hypothetical protein